jgi:hypothetical protein
MNSAISNFESAINKKQSGTKKSGHVISTSSDRSVFLAFVKALSCVLESDECVGLEDRAQLLKLIIEQSDLLRKSMASYGVSLDEKSSMILFCELARKVDLYDYKKLCEIYPITEYAAHFIKDDLDVNEYSFSQQSLLKTLLKMVPRISRAFSEYANERNLFISIIDTIQQAVNLLVKSVNLKCEIDDEIDVYVEACVELYISTLDNYLMAQDRAEVLLDDLKKIRIQFGKNIGILLLTLESSLFLRSR